MFCNPPTRPITDLPQKNNDNYKEGTYFLVRLTEDGSLPEKFENHVKALIENYNSKNPDAMVSDNPDDWGKKYCSPKTEYLALANEGHYPKPNVDIPNLVVVDIPLQRNVPPIQRLEGHLSDLVPPLP